jgi:hypothetical protein
MKLRITSTKESTGEEYTSETTLENILGRLMDEIYRHSTGEKWKHQIEIVKE